MTPTKTDYVALLTAALAAPFTRPARGYGCGRAYVAISGSDRKVVNGVASAAKKLGKIFQRKGYAGARNVLYIGYDNATGEMLAKAEAVATYLTNNGVSAYSDAYAD